MRWRDGVGFGGFCVALVACSYFTAAGKDAESDAGAGTAADEAGASASGSGGVASDAGGSSASSSGSSASSTGGTISSSSSSGGGAALSAFQSTLLEGLNARRAAAPSASPALPVLTWNDADATLAKTYTDTCDVADPPNGAAYGGGTAPYTADDVLARIDDAKAHYTYDNNTCSNGSCTLYKVVVQRTVTTVGCDFTACGAEDRWSCIFRTIGDTQQPPY